MGGNYAIWALFSSCHIQRRYRGWEQQIVDLTSQQIGVIMPPPNHGPPENEGGGQGGGHLAL